MTKEECISLLNRYAEYGNIGIPNLIRFREAMRTAAELLQQPPPSLPSNLDEAAERIVVSLIPTFGQKYKVRDCFSRDELIRLVKAGAEWMAGQGVTAEAEILDVPGRPLVDKVIRTMSIKDMKQCLKDFNNGDNVIVQIRKK